MKYKAVIEVVAESYAEEQFILNRFPNATWIPLKEKIIFYIPYLQHSEVKKAIEEWEKANG